MKEEKKDKYEEYRQNCQEFEKAWDDFIVAIMNALTPVIAFINKILFKIVSWLRSRRIAKLIEKGEKRQWK